MPLVLIYGSPSYVALDSHWRLSREEWERWSHPSRHHHREWRMGPVIAPDLLSLEWQDNWYEWETYTISIDMSVVEWIDVVGIWWRLYLCSAIKVLHISPPCEQHLPQSWACGAITHAHELLRFHWLRHLTSLLLNCNIRATLSVYALIFETYCLKLY